MKKYFCLLLLLSASVPSVWAAALPDNMYFRAMRDELLRTRKELRVKGSPRPFFTAYKVISAQAQGFSALFGAPYASSGKPQSDLQALVYIYAGDAKNNSSGFANDAYYYRPSSASSIPVSYEGLRRILWRLTDAAYVAASNSYEKKEAYKRQKNIAGSLPDFTKAPKAAYMEAMPDFPDLDASACQDLVNALSARGKELPYLEMFSAVLTVSLQRVYFLDSEGDFYQYARPLASLTLSAALRNRDGYKENLSESVPLVFGQMPDKEKMMAETDAFLERLRDMYLAGKAEPYLGPVLLQPKAAGGFFNQLFVRNANNSKPLLSAQAETDGTAGQFKDKKGMRVISHLLDVYDRPALKQYRGEILTGFMPVDDEGVAARELQLVQNGKLTALPAVRSPIEGQKQSNGRARMSSWTYPRAALTNVFFVPKNPLTEEELERKFLDRCRELDLEYCYIFPRFPSVSAGRGELNFAWRVYSADGRKEPVYGLRLEGLTTRSLRDVLAAGDDETVSYFSTSASLPVSVVAPSVIVDEIEILPTQRKPDRKPFVPLP